MFLKNKLRRFILWSGLFTLTLFLIVNSRTYFNQDKDPGEDIVLLSEAQPRSFAVEVPTVGELEAARSTIIASSIRGDQGKVIYLIPDGITVEPHQILVKMDPTPFEEKIAELKTKINDQSAIISMQIQTLEWEKNQADVEEKTCEYEIESANLELQKTVKGDGPLELFRLESAMQKSWSKYEELSAYSDDLIKMEEAGYINHAERKQAEKKLQEEREAYENAKLQYETYSEHVHPMIVKKAETALRRCQLRQDEVIKGGQYKIEKAQAALQQAEHVKKDLLSQLHAAQMELAQTEIRAPTHGMIVHREEYRTGQKRKPRVGDILVRNQPILDLPDLNTMIVKTKVREVDLYKVQIGKSVLIEVDAYPQVFFKGNVQSIGVLALADMARNGVEKYFEVKIAMSNTDEKLRPGMTARATILTDKLENTLTVPVSAVFVENKKSCCYVARQNSFVVTPIRIGAHNDQWIEITEGLQSGDQVALTTPSPEYILPGSP
ncbi:MAG: efflux RND transporter periplasmic adaptor subunit [Parachlamydiales bacterium]|jgi:HlyD family secretion protein